MKITKHLQLEFFVKNDDTRKIRFQIPDPIDELDDTDVVNLMNLMIEKNVFSKYGGLKSISSAKVIERSVSQFEVV